MSIVEMVREGESIEKIEKAFNALSHEERLEEMYKFKSKDQDKLYELASGRYAGPDFFVPKKRYGQEVIHWGVNSLPFFSKFQKRMTAKNGGKTTSYSGYNEQTMKGVTGPGYFSLLDKKEGPHGKKQVAINYYDEPGFKYDSWSKMAKNTSGLSRFVYGNMHDWMWKVSDHVSIGKANKNGKFMNNWFILCRED